MERLFTTDELCETWQVRKSWVYDEVQSGRLPHVKLGNQLRFRQLDLDEYLAARSVTNDEAAGARATGQILAQALRDVKQDAAA